MTSAIARLLATWFYCGLVPKGPGTAGSAGAILVAWILYRWAGFGPAAFGVLAILTLPIAIWAADRVARYAGSKDPQIVVIDEVVGQWIALAGAYGASGNLISADLPWPTWIAAFLLFRAFDIVKPAPVRQLERIPGGAGIVLDDAMAGVYAALVLAAAGWFNL